MAMALALALAHPPVACAKVGAQRRCSEKCRTGAWSWLRLRVTKAVSIKLWILYGIPHLIRHHAVSRQRTAHGRTNTASKMALWNCLGQADTVAQLAGVDIGGLILMIVQAVQTVHRNREECCHLMHHVMMIGDLLQTLQQSEMVQYPEIRRPLDGLEETLRQAYLLVTSCQQNNIMRRFLLARNQAQRFRDIRDRIDSYQRMYP